MDLLIALLLQSAVEPPRVSHPSVAQVRTAARSVAGSRPRLSYRPVDEPPAPAGPGGARRGSVIDWESLDASLARPAEREAGSAPSGAAREQLWRGVPVIVVNGQRHGLW